MMSIGWVIARWRRARPRSLLDNTPLEELLGKLVGTERLRQVMRDGHLQALAVTASSYGSGLHVTFYDALDDIVPWTRSQRIAVRAAITMPHLLASSAIPFVFPGGRRSTSTARTEYCGDGSMRQAAPISPAVHLGAERILVVGAGRMHEPPGERAPQQRLPEPRADRRPCAVEHLPRRARGRRRAAAAHQRDAGAAAAARRAPTTSLKPIEVLVIAPSERLDDIAAQAPGRACRCRSARCCAASASRARATTRAARRWRATCCSRRPTRAS